MKYVEWGLLELWRFLSSFVYDFLVSTCFLEINVYMWRFMFFSNICEYYITTVCWWFTLEVNLMFERWDQLYWRAPVVAYFIKTDWSLCNPRDQFISRRGYGLLGEGHGRCTFIHILIIFWRMVLFSYNFLAYHLPLLFWLLYGARFDIGYTVIVDFVYGMI